MTHALPSGVVTFVFTDIEESTPLFERLGDDYHALQERHRALLRNAFAAHGGQEVSTEGDSFFVAFTDPAAAVASCVQGQRALLAETWPAGAEIRVRMGVHSGAATPVDGSYTALCVHAAARVMAAGNGGQIVVSDVVRAMAGDVEAEYVDVGPHRLRGLAEPFHLYLVRAPGMSADDRPLRTARVVTSNIPIVDTPLIGRDDELADLVARLRVQRSVTVTGTGGVGKTRLALAAAAVVADDFPEGSWFADLHALRADDDVAAQVAQLLQTAGDAEVVEGVVRAVGDGRVLVVLDNCEHLISGAAALAGALVRSCPNATVLATSREPLGVPGEHTWRAPSLSSDAAAALLTDRIGEARGGYAPSADDAEHLAAIARRLDGIPLALELAAARCGAMALADVARRLDERFRLLTGARGSLSRHQTLEAAVSWSVDLLDEKTRTVFRRLAAFAGGWTLAAAEEVAAVKGLDALDVDDALAALVGKSLVTAHLGLEPARYSFLETVRQYAQAELVRAGEAEAVYDRHTAYFVQLAGSLDEMIPGPQEGGALARLADEMDNAQAAFDWAEGNGDLTSAALLASALSDAATTLGRGAQVMPWLQRTVAAADQNPGALAPEVHADLLVAGARVGARHLLDDAAQALPRLERAWQMLQETPAVSDHRKAMTALWLSRYLVDDGQFERAVALRKLAIDLLADRPAARAVALAGLGRMTVSLGGRAEGKAMLHDALSLGERAATVRAVIGALSALAWVASMEDDIALVDELLTRIEANAATLPPAAEALELGDAARRAVAAELFELGVRLATKAVDRATASGRADAVVDAAYAAGEAAAGVGDVERAEREWALVADLAARQSRTSHALISRYRLALLYQLRGELAAERRVIDEARPYAMRLRQLPQVAWYLIHGRLELAQGNAAGARQAFRTAIELADQGRVSWEMGAVPDYLSGYCHAAGRYEDALRLAALSYAQAPEAEHRTASSVMYTRERRARDAELAAMFSSERYAALCEEGRAWTLEDVARVADELTTAS